MSKKEIVEKIAEQLQIDASSLFNLIQRRGDLYKVWYRKKPGGGKRCVEEPLKDLKIVQRIIVDKLHLKFHKSVQGGVIGRSIRTNALEHKRGQKLLRMDIKNAYPSTTQKHIYELFKHLGAPTREARLWTKLVTFRGHLPQGAPTSLPLFNLVLNEMWLDRRFSKIHGVKYTRYVDDLVFTSNKRRILKNLKQEVTDFLKARGFMVNKKKTKYYTSKNRALRITGVNIIDGQPKIPPKMIRKFRGMIGRAIMDDSVSKQQVFGIIAFTIGIERKIPNQLLKPLLRYLTTKNITNCPFIIEKWAKP